PPGSPADGPGGAMRPLRPGAVSRQSLLAAGGRRPLRGLRGPLAPSGAGPLPEPGGGGGTMTTLLRMAASYRQSGDLIRLRIIALRDAAKASDDPDERSRLEQRIRDLNALYRDTREIA